MKIRLDGMDKLQKKLKDNVTMDDVKRAVKQNTSDLQEKAQDNAPVDTGHLRDSIEVDISANGMTGTVVAKTDYAEYVELGTRFQVEQP